MRNAAEGLIVVGIGLVLSVIIGGGIGYVLCSFLKNNLMNYLNYQFPADVPGQPLPEHQHKDNGRDDQQRQIVSKTIIRDGS